MQCQLQKGAQCGKDGLTKVIDIVYHGDAIQVLPDKVPDKSVDLIITSPPYADARRNVYGGIHPDKYVEWFTPFAEQFKRVLKPTGSFVLNIKERVVNGERHTYVINLVLALKRMGWLWVDEYCWHKKNSHPGKWKNRFRDAWERCFHFTLSQDFKMFQDAVMIPQAESSRERSYIAIAGQETRKNSKTRSGFGVNQTNYYGREMVYPSNVLHLATVCHNNGHSAAFPLDLPLWFIKLFTEAGDTVLDPFCGSGTSLVAAQQLCRRYIGIELLRDYWHLSESNLAGDWRKLLAED